MKTYVSSLGLFHCVSVGGFSAWVSETGIYPPIRLRSEPLIVPTDEFKEVFKLDNNRRPREYIRNDFEDQGEVVVDQATGLMWQKSGSAEELEYEDAREYIQQLNRQRFAGYDDWRLPTIEELMSLLEPEKQSNGLYISPVFDVKQPWCWSADRNARSAWVGVFILGVVDWGRLNENYVRGVRDNVTRAEKLHSAAQEREPLRKEGIIPTATPTLQSETGIRTPIRLRSEPLTDFSLGEAIEFYMSPDLYIKNDFEEQGEVVIDHATGLMWQKPGSDEALTDKAAQTYIERLNHKRFAGYDDWRLPTVEELVSLLEPEKQSNGLYISPLFGAKQSWFWSADRNSSGGAWGVLFTSGNLDWLILQSHNYVRSVR